VLTMYRLADSEGMTHPRNSGELLEPAAQWQRPWVYGVGQFVQHSAKKTGRTQCISAQATSGLRQADQRLSSTARARLTFSRTSDALAVQTKGFGLPLCLSM
jgi:hypothetical protein